MFRCTECSKEYEKYPGYCECGNDEFEEIITSDNSFDDENDEIEEKKVLTPKERAELAKLEQEKKKSLIAIGVICFLCLVILFLPPYRTIKQDNIKKTKTAYNKKLPTVSTYWIDDLPSGSRQNNPIDNLPLLNKQFNSISPSLRDYLMTIGRTFNAKWNTALVEGSGSCKVRFVLNKEGSIDYKNIISSTGNRSLNDSVSLLFNNIDEFAIPPEDYRGEKIYILFSVDKNGISKVTYPVK